MLGLKRLLSGAREGTKNLYGHAMKLVGREEGAIRRLDLTSTQVSDNEKLAIDQINRILTRTGTFGTLAHSKNGIQQAKGMVADVPRIVNELHEAHHVISERIEVLQSLRNNETELFADLVGLSHIALKGMEKQLLDLIKDLSPGQIRERVKGKFGALGLLQKLSKSLSETAEKLENLVNNELRLESQFLTKLHDPNTLREMLKDPSRASQEGLQHLQKLREIVTEKHDSLLLALSDIETQFDEVRKELRRTSHLPDSFVQIFEMRTEFNAFTKELALRLSHSHEIISFSYVLELEDYRRLESERKSVVQLMDALRQLESNLDSEIASTATSMKDELQRLLEEVKFDENQLAKLIAEVPKMEKMISSQISDETTLKKTTKFVSRMGVKIGASAATGGISTIVLLGHKFTNTAQELSFNIKYLNKVVEREMQTLFTVRLKNISDEYLVPMYYFLSELIQDGMEKLKKGSSAFFKALNLTLPQLGTVSRNEAKTRYQQWLAVASPAQQQALPQVMSLVATVVITAIMIGDLTMNMGGEV